MTTNPINERISRNEELSLLIESVQDYAIFLLTPIGEISTWNRGAARIMGYTKDEVVGRHFSIFYGPEDIQGGKPGYELEVATHEGRVEDEGWRVRKDGARFWANTVITALRNDEGALRGFAKVTRDMSQRRAAEEARRAAEEQLRQGAEVFQLLVSSVRDYAIFMLDPEGYITTWNSGAQAIKGYRPGEIIGRHMSTFYSAEDVENGKPARELAIARAEGKVEDEGWRIRKDGTRFWANVLITSVYDTDGTLRGFAKVTRDITDRKIAEETRQALQEQREARRRAEASYLIAQEANRAKDEFLMTLSHELRTPMTAILGWAKMLPLMSPQDPIFGEAVQSIASGAQLQARLIDDILDISRIVSGKLRLTPEPVEVARVILSAVDAVSTTATAKEITLTTALAPALGTMHVDSTRIQQVIWNLLTNALKFTPRGGAVTISASRSAMNIQISIQDNGEGIDPEFLPHVFEPFRQAESPHTRVHGGLGLGLSIVRQIAEAHGGSIHAASEGRGKGATFTVTLPAISNLGSPEAASNTPANDKLRQGGRLRTLSIAVIENDNESRKMVAAALRSAGANVIAFDSAMSALEAIEHHQPDIVITDIALPEVDGYEFTRKLRERAYGAAIKIVALSAFPAALEKKSYFDAYLSKPIDPFQLVDEIAKIASGTVADPQPP